VRLWIESQAIPSRNRPAIRNWLQSAMISHPQLILNPQSSILN
jgi:hypothetical protein